MTDGVRVEIREGDCPCPGSPHPVESVILLPSLTLPLASAALAEMRDADPTVGGQEAALVRAYLPAAILSWSFVEQTPDGKGIRPVPTTRENMDRLIPWSRGGLEVAEKADELYSEDLMRPLLVRMSKQSPRGLTDDSTSQTRRSGSQPPVRSLRSSRKRAVGKRSGAPAP